MTLDSEQEKAIRNAIKLDGLGKDDQYTLRQMLSKKADNNVNASLFVDGAADLHSKTAGIGGVVYVDGKEIATFSEPLFEKTNNESEYLALLRGIKLLQELKFIKVAIFADSQLVVNQVNGEYKVKNDRMKVLHSNVLSLLQLFDKWTINHILRGKNVRADELSKLGMEKARTEK